MGTPLVSEGTPKKVYHKWQEFWCTQLDLNQQRQPLQGCALHWSYECGATQGNRTLHKRATRALGLLDSVWQMVGAVGVEPTFDPNQGPVFPLDDAPTNLFQVLIL